MKGVKQIHSIDRDKGVAKCYPLAKCKGRHPIATLGGATSNVTPLKGVTKRDPLLQRAITKIHDIKGGGKTPPPLVRNQTFIHGVVKRHPITKIVEGVA